MPQAPPEHDGERPRSRRQGSHSGSGKRQIADLCLWRVGRLIVIGRPDSPVLGGSGLPMSAHTDVRISARWAGRITVRFFHSRVPDLGSLRTRRTGR
jgi:hypothetical protein